MRRFAPVFLAALVFVAANDLRAQMPRTLMYQGILTDTLGAPRTDGLYSFTFRLYTSAVGGGAIWTETESVQLKQGIFSSVLGDQVPFEAAIAFDRQYWLGVQVGSDPEMVPRTMLAASPYSLRAARSDTAAIALSAPASSYTDSARVASTVPPGSVTTGLIADNAINSAKLLDGSVTGAKVANGALTASKIAAGAVVKSLNTLRDSVTIVGSGGITVTPSGSTITISSSGVPGGGDITAVLAGAGLTGGGLSGDVTLSLADSGVTAQKIGPAAVGTSKIADAAVTTVKIADASVTSLKIADASVSGAKILTGAVTGQKIPSGQVVKSINTLRDSVTLLGSTSVTITPLGNTLTFTATGGGTGGVSDVLAGLGLSRVAASGVVTLSVADSGVAARHLASSSVTTAKLAGGSVTGAKLSLPLSVIGSTSDYSTGIIAAENQLNGAGLRGLSNYGDGVFGFSTQHHGVHGQGKEGGTAGTHTPSGNWGVLGTQDFGIYGRGSSAFAISGGVYGEHSASGNWGVLGHVDYGVYARGQSGTVRSGGIKGEHTATGNWGILGTVDYGVGGHHALSMNTGTIGTLESGAYGYHNNGGNFGHLGMDSCGAYGESQTKIGIIARSKTANGIESFGGETGVYGEGGTHGMYGYGSIDGVYGSGGVYGVYGNAPAVGVQGESWSNIGVLGISNTSGTGLYGVSGTGNALYLSGGLYQSGGKFEAHPTTTVWTTSKPATVKINDGTQVKLFAEEAAEVLFSDYGEGRLSGGRTHVDLDPTFLQTVTIDAAHPMKVFVQLEDDCRGVYVANKTTTGFDVVELQGGASAARFSYRVVCKRKFYEEARLATEAQDRMYNERMMKQVWPEIIAAQEKALEQIKKDSPLQAPRPVDRNRGKTGK